MNNKVRVGIWWAVGIVISFLVLAQEARIRHSQRLSQMAWDKALQTEKTNHRIRMALIEHGGFEYIPYGDEEVEE